MKKKYKMDDISSIEDCIQADESVGASTLIIQDTNPMAVKQDVLDFFKSDIFKEVLAVKSNYSKQGHTSRVEINYIPSKESPVW